MAAFAFSACWVRYSASLSLAGSAVGPGFGFSLDGPLFDVMAEVGSLLALSVFILGHQLLLECAGELLEPDDDPRGRPTQDEQADDQIAEPPLVPEQVA